MEYKIINNTAKASEIYTNFVSELYSDSQLKPKVQNLNNSLSFLVIEDNNETKAVASIFINESFPNNLIIGNYECINDSRFAQAIFKEIETIALENHCHELTGPMNGSTWFTYRYSLENNLPFFMETVHKKYYVSQWKEAGFHSAADYQSNIERVRQEVELPDYKKYFKTCGLMIRDFKPNDAENEFKALHEFCMNSFKNNVLFSPISQEDFLGLYMPLVPHLNPKLINFVFDDDKMVGMFFAIENLFKPNEVIVKTIARNLDRKYRGLGHYLAALFYQKFIDMKFDTMLHVYFHVNNKSSQVSNKYGGTSYQKHILFQKDLA